MSSCFDIKNNVVVITGGAGLIGSCFTQALCDAGANVVLADYNSEQAQVVIDEILAKNKEAKISFVSIDITNKESVQSCIQTVISEHEKIDAVINNAYPRNKNYGKHYFDVMYEDFCENLGMNLGGYFLVGQKFAEYFKQAGGGNIINIASIYGVIAPDFSIYDEANMTSPVEYACIKSGLIHLTKYMANYFKGTDIRVNAISLGGIQDGQDSRFLAKYNAKCLNKGMLDADDIVGTLLFLLSDASKFINGQNIVVDDGFTL